jgi:hypothetical protein
MIQNQVVFLKGMCRAQPKRLCTVGVSYQRKTIRLIASNPLNNCEIHGTEKRIHVRLHNRCINQTSGFCSDIRSLKNKGDIYSRTTGVELKYDDDDDEINWNTPVDFSNIPELVKRCMSKYPSVVPTEVSVKKVKLLLIKLPGFVDSDVGDEVYQDFLGAWSQAYQNNIEEIMFKNLSSYEP